MKFSGFFSFIIMHIFTKNHDFLTNINEFFFHGSLFLLRNFFKKILVDNIILTSYLIQKFLRKNHRKKLQKHYRKRDRKSEI